MLGESHSVKLNSKIWESISRSRDHHPFIVKVWDFLHTCFYSPVPKLVPTGQESQDPLTLILLAEVEESAWCFEQFPFYDCYFLFPPQKQLCLQTRHQIWHYKYSFWFIPFSSGECPQVSVSRSIAQPTECCCLHQVLNSSGGNSDRLCTCSLLGFSSEAPNPCHMQSIFSSFPLPPV